MQSPDVSQAVDMNVRERAANVPRAQLRDFVQVSFETRGNLRAAFLVYIVAVLIGLVAYGSGSTGSTYPGIVGLARLLTPHLSASRRAIGWKVTILLYAA